MLRSATCEVAVPVWRLRTARLDMDPYRVHTPEVQEKGLRREKEHDGSYLSVIVHICTGTTNRLTDECECCELLAKCPSYERIAAVLQCGIL